MSKPPLVARFFGHWGYVKVPKEAVMLSLLNEAYWERIVEVCPGFKKCLEAQQTLTRFLSSGRIVSVT